MVNKGIRCLIKKGQIPIRTDSIIRLLLQDHVDNKT